MKSCFDQILATVHKNTGIDVAGYRRPILERRLASRMGKLGLDDLQAYLQRLDADPSEHNRFINALGINVSSFFRNPLVFEILHNKIIPDILEAKRHRQSNEVRIWSAGCAAGEEVYSLAIQLHKAMKGEVAHWAPRIFATDMDEDALEMAHAAVYPRARFESTKLGLLDEYFVPHGAGFKLRPFIRKMVRFSHHDLTSQKTTVPPDSVFGNFDLTLCRNVLIYFSRATQVRILDNLCKSVAKGGYLVLGESESLHNERKRGFERASRYSKIYRKRLR